MEYTQWACKVIKIIQIASLNPCCNGIYSMSSFVESELSDTLGLNPCCNGIYSMRSSGNLDKNHVVERLNPCCNGIYSMSAKSTICRKTLGCLNPCCNGIYSMSESTCCFY